MFETTNLKFTSASYSRNLFALTAVEKMRMHRGIVLDVVIEHILLGLKLYIIIKVNHCGLSLKLWFDQLKIFKGYFALITSENLVAFLNLTKTTLHIYVKGIIKLFRFLIYFYFYFMLLTTLVDFP